MTSQQHPHCYADLDTVFPLRTDGLRATPGHCLQCVHKIDCLRAAMQQIKGLKVRQEMVDRAYHSGVISFFQRWSQKKIFSIE